MLELLTQRRRGLNMGGIDHGGAPGPDPGVVGDQPSLGADMGQRSRRRRGRPASDQLSSRWCPGGRSSRGPAGSGCASPDATGSVAAAASPPVRLHQIGRGSEGAPGHGGDLEPAVAALHQAPWTPDPSAGNNTSLVASVPMNCSTPSARRLPRPMPGSLSQIRRRGTRPKLLEQFPRSPEAGPQSSTWGSSGR